LGTLRRSAGRELAGHKVSAPARAVPTAAPNRHGKAASMTTSAPRVECRKPTVERTANSGIRSRTDCAMAFAVTSRIMKSPAAATGQAIDAAEIPQREAFSQFDLSGML